MTIKVFMLIRFFIVYCSLLLKRKKIYKDKTLKKKGNDLLNILQNNKKIKAELLKLKTSYFDKNQPFDMTWPLSGSSGSAFNELFAFISKDIPTNKVMRLTLQQSISLQFNYVEFFNKYTIDNEIMEKDDYFVGSPDLSGIYRENMDN